MNKDSFDWNRNMAKSFEFIPSEEFQNDYVLGKFLLEDFQKTRSKK